MVQRDDAEASSQTYLQAMGAKVRALRTERGLSLAELATRSGLSKSMLSMVERGQANCTISSIIGIASAFGVPLSELFESADSSSPIVRWDDLKVALSEEGERRIYAYNRAHNVEISDNLYKPGAISSPTPRRHSGWECGVVLEGSLEVEVDGEMYVVDEGDSFRFDSHSPHRFLNRSDSWTRILWVNITTGTPGKASNGT